MKSEDKQTNLPPDEMTVEKYLENKFVSDSNRYAYSLSYGQQYKTVEEWDEIFLDVR